VNLHCCPVQIQGRCCNSYKTSVDPHIAALYNKARKELIIRLTKDDGKSAQQRIVSVVGFGGLGKTALAKAVYMT
jgi:disease resistance protein RPM1